LARKAVWAANSARVEEAFGEGSDEAHFYEQPQHCLDGSKSF